jgi:hypothetical protein
MSELLGLQWGLCTNFGNETRGVVLGCCFGCTASFQDGFIIRPKTLLG